ncbi:hypothetical protein Nmel_000526, partial [Mimus melanotis]
LLVKVPFSTINLKTWEKCLQYIIKQHNPDWSDIQLLLNALTKTKKQLVLKKAGNLAEEFCRA